MFFSTKNLYKLHVYVGVFVAVHFLVLSLTGALLLWKDELQPQVVAAVSTQTPLPLETILRRALAEFPDDRPLSLFPDEKDPGLVNLRLGINGSQKFRGARKLSFDAYTGKPREAAKTADGFFGTLLTLHRELFLGTYGKLYVGFVGLLFVFTLISGFLIYGGFIGARSYGEIRRRAANQVLPDFHKFVGVTVFGWALLVGITGAALGLNSTLIKFYQYRELKYLQAHSAGGEGSSAPVDAVIATALRARPGTHFSFLAFPGNEFSVPGNFLVLVNGATPLTEKLAELVVVNGATAELVEARALPWYLKFVMLAEPLHFGNYGGIPFKIFWLLFTLATLSLALSGLFSFIQKKRARRSITPRENLMLSRGRAFRSAYLLPIVFACMSLGGAAAALFFKGPVNVLAGLILGFPVLFVVYALIRYRWGQK